MDIKYFLPEARDRHIFQYDRCSNMHENPSHSESYTVINLVIIKFITVHVTASCWPATARCRIS